MRQLKMAPQPDYLPPDWITPWAAFQVVAGHNNQDDWNEDETLDANSVGMANAWKQFRDFLVTGQVSYIIQAASGNQYGGQPADWATDEAYEMFNTGRRSVSAGPLYFEYVEEGIVLISENDLTVALAPTKNDSAGNSDDPDRTPADVTDTGSNLPKTDESLLNDMESALKGDKPPSSIGAASLLFGDKASGGGTPISKAKRLERKYRKSGKFNPRA